ncbi:hypothetical protein ACFVYV_44720 [Streptomyces mirabilis]|uniref:hypothetical protein n=1 Tax=Streptomyces mirabilis TaxID=68239 RepID=UPI0036DBADF8
MGLGLKSLAEVCFLGRERAVRAADADSAGARDVVRVPEVGEVGVRLGDGLGARLLLLGLPPGKLR